MMNTVNPVVQPGRCQRCWKPVPSQTGPSFCVGCLADITATVVVPLEGLVVFDVKQRELQPVPTVVVG